MLFAGRKFPELDSRSTSDGNTSQGALSKVHLRLSHKRQEPSKPTRSSYLSSFLKGTCSSRNVIVAFGIPFPCTKEKFCLRNCPSTIPQHQPWILTFTHNPRFRSTNPPAPHRLQMSHLRTKISTNRVWCSGNIADSLSAARGSTPRIPDVNKKPIGW